MKKNSSLLEYSDFEIRPKSLKNLEWEIYNNINNINQLYGSEYAWEVLDLKSNKILATHEIIKFKDVSSDKDIFNVESSNIKVKEGDSYKIDSPKIKSYEFINHNQNNNEIKNVKSDYTIEYKYK